MFPHVYGYHALECVCGYAPRTAADALLELCATHYPFVLTSRQKARCNVFDRDALARTCDPQPAKAGVVAHVN